MVEFQWTGWNRRVNAFLCAVPFVALIPSCAPKLVDTRPAQYRDPNSLVFKCDAACEQMSELKCEGWRGFPGYDKVYGTEDDAGCMEVCMMTDFDKESAMKPSCVAVAKTCKEVDGCHD